MGLKLNLSRVKGDMDALKNTSFRETPPGRGMMQVKEFREYGHQKTGSHELVMELVAWTNPEGIGIEHTELIFPDRGDRDDDQCAARLLRVAIATGMITPKEAEDARNGSGELDLDFTTALPGRVMMVEIIARPNKDGKVFANIGEGGFAFYHCKDERCKDWPRHVALINQNGHLIGEWQPLKKDTPAPKAAAPKPSVNPFAAKV